MTFEEFLFYDKDWIYKQFQRLEFVRSPKYYTFKIALNLLLQNNGKIIVETGTQRMIDDPGGCSTLLFGAFCQRYGKKLFTVDNNQKNIDTSKQATQAYSDHITYVLADSVQFLQTFNRHIDLLYLDSKDCPVTGDATEAQQQQLNEFLAAENKLSEGSIYLGDDSAFENGGKTRLLKKYLISKPEWRCVLDWGQALWIKVR